MWQRLSGGGEVVEMHIDVPGGDRRLWSELELSVWWDVDVTDLASSRPSIQLPLGQLFGIHWSLSPSTNGVTF